MPFSDEIMPWEDIRDRTPEDPELHALAVSLQDKKLRAQIENSMLDRAAKDADEHDKILRRSRQLLAHDARFI